VETAAISPDGKYLLSEVNDNGMRSLWLRNIPTGSDTQIIPPSTGTFTNLTFSPDGNYIYFRKPADARNTAYDLYRAPVLGGTPQAIVHDIDSGISFSPDGRRITYVRHNDPELGKTRLLTATSEGSDEKILHIVSRDEFWRSPAWSPDGKTIALLFDPGNGFSGMKQFDIGTRRARDLAVFDDTAIDGFLWLPDGRGMLLLFRKTPNLGRSQIGFLSRTGGGIRPITRDTSDYWSLALSGDAKALAAVQGKPIFNPSVLAPDWMGPQEASALPSQQKDFVALNWTPDGNLLEGARDGTRLRRRDYDGKNATELLTDPNGGITRASPCGKRYLMVEWGSHAGSRLFNIWRVNLDGSGGATRLTNGKGDSFAVCTSDEKWVYYYDEAGLGQIKRVPIDGSGKAEGVTKKTDFSGFLVKDQFDISPDGKMLACSARETVPEDPGKAFARVALLTLDAPRSTRLLDANPKIAGGVQFTPDGKAVLYPIRENGIENLWFQPLDGSVGHQITKFDSDLIFWFQRSPDGKKLLIMRGHWESDVVLLHETEP